MVKKRSNVIDFAAEKKRRKKAQEKAASTEVVVFVPRPEFISFEEAYKTAERIVKRYSRPGALLRDFLERQKSEKNLERNLELHQAINSQRKMVAAFPTPDLKTMMGHYVSNSDHFDGVYALAAAEEFIKRMGDPKHLPWK